MSNGNKITFLGAAQNVTGSCYMLEICGLKLFVDCGFYQERKFKSRNWEPFAVNPSEIDAVLLTHAHLDHCGLLPKFVKEGFKGNIFCTPATAEIAEIVMLDSAKIQEYDAAYKKKRHAREGRTGPHPVVPLYEIVDAEAAVPMLSKVEYKQPLSLNDNVSVSFHEGGHILGSSMIKIKFGEESKQKTIIFSGDVGRWNVPIICDPTSFDHADYVVVESTYGNRVHENNDEIPDKLADAINAAVKRGGNVVIPSFAVERTQELLYHINLLLQDKRIPQIPIIVDSPMAIRVTEVFRKHKELFDEKTLQLLYRGMHPCDFPNLVFSMSTEESKSINERKDPYIVIAGSGMCTGGRIKHHLKQNIEREESVILFIGYQATGTLGRRLINKEKRVRIHGSEYDVHAEIRKINGFSAHADRNELMKWLSGFTSAPSRVFVTHGEEEAALAFADFIKSDKGWNVMVPEYRESAEL
ncbi:MBL fold metallo-hydrolase RNA specificity domain-containing protein [Verrucomicrobiota bacterium]